MKYVVHILAVVVLLSQQPAAWSQQPADSETKPAASAEPRPSETSVSLQGYMTLLRQHTNEHLAHLANKVSLHIETANRNVERWATIGAAFLALLTLLGFTGLWSIFRYARSKAEAMADGIIQEQMENTVERFEKQARESAAAIERQMEKSVAEAVQRIEQQYREKVEAMQELVGAETQATMEELEAIRSDMAGLRPAAVADAAKKKEKSRGSADQSPANRTTKWQAMREALLNHKFVWRSIERLAGEASTSTEDAMDILGDHSDEVVISRGKSGRTIARHVQRRPKQK